MQKDVCLNRESLAGSSVGVVKVSEKENSEKKIFSLLMAVPYVLAVPDILWGRRIYFGAVFWANKSFSRLRSFVFQYLLFLKNQLSNFK